MTLVNPTLYPQVVEDASVILSFYRRVASQKKLFSYAKSRSLRGVIRVPRNHNPMTGFAANTPECQGECTIIALKGFVNDIG